MTKQNKDTDNQEAHKYYFDFSGDFNNLNRDYKSTVKISNKKKKRKYTSVENSERSEHKNEVEASTSPDNCLSTKIHSKHDQDINNARKNKNIYINFSYRDNSKSFFMSNRRLPTTNNQKFETFPKLKDDNQSEKGKDSL